MDGGVPQHKEELSENVKTLCHGGLENKLIMAPVTILTY
jgi:hypothetical protein